MAEETTQLAKPKEHSNPVVALLQREQVKEKFKEILGKKSSAFITSVLAVVNTSDKLKKATPDSVYSAAMMAAVLDLPINPNLGFAYIIPYNTKQKDRDGKEHWVVQAQFQMGYKGFIQLGQRSGLYKTMAAAPIYEGQIRSADPLRGYEFDFTVKGKEVIGYAAYFALINGFEKYSYMTIEEMNAHAKQYSKTYKDESSKWRTDFHSMAMKTVLKLLISKFGPLSVDMQMQKAVQADQAVIGEVDESTLDVEYVDANESPLQPTADDMEANKETEEVARLRFLIANGTEVAKLEKLRTAIGKIKDKQTKLDLLLDLAEKIEIISITPNEESKP